MDKETAKRVMDRLYMVDIDSIEETIDVLVDEGVVERCYKNKCEDCLKYNICNRVRHLGCFVSKPKKRSILDEKWDVRSHEADGLGNVTSRIQTSDGNYMIVTTSSGKFIAFDQAIAAAPDMARALKEIRDHTDGHSDAYIIDGKLMSKICVALQKAGVV